VRTSLKYINKQLVDLYPETEIRSFWLLIMEQLTGCSRMEILTNKNNILSAEQNQKVKTIIERLKKAEPIQYILGETEFFSLPFYVDENVLIPRPETEELVDWVLNDNQNCKGKILDIGTGSGCIAISLAKNLPNAHVTAFDISEEAIAVAKRNASRNEVEVNFQPVDVLSPDFFKKEDSETFDIIISNPPYVCEREKAGMQTNVLKYEPHLALFVDDNDPLLFYRQIALFAHQHLISNGKLFFEINQAYGKKTVKLLVDLGFSDVCLRKDISGKNRMIKAIR